MYLSSLVRVIRIYVDLTGQNISKTKAAFRRTLAMCALVTALALSACAAPSSYMGIDISNPAPEFTLNEDQKVYFKDRRLVLVKAKEAGCIAEDEKPLLLSAKQLAACDGMADEYFALERDKPVFDFVRQYQEMQISTLGAKAQSGDKHAQLELGIRFEEGRGVERDLKKARKLYAKAAASSGGRIWVYSPPVGNGTSGRVIPVNAGPKQSGLAEAKRRLEGLE